MTLVLYQISNLRQYVSFAEYLIYSLGTRDWIIVQFLRREPSVSRPGYNDSVSEINGLLPQKQKHILLWTQGILVGYVSTRQRCCAPCHPPSEKPEARDPPSPMKSIGEAKGMRLSCILLDTCHCISISWQPVSLSQIIKIWKCIYNGPFSIIV